MRRFDWAKVYCDILRHPLLAQRPDCDARLAIGLILHAKEYFPNDGIIRGMDAEEMRSAFRIKAPVQRVQEAFEYFLKRGWVRWVDEQGSFSIKDFLPRQKKRDPPEAQRGRAKTYYDKHRDEVLEKRAFSRRSHGQSHDGSHDVSADGLTTVSQPQSHGEVEGEVDQDRDRRAVGGESEGRIGAACEYVDNQPPMPANLSESERSHFLKLWSDGKGSDATAFLASIQRKRGAL